MQEIKKLQGRKSDFQDLEKEREEINQRMQVSMSRFINNPYLAQQGGRFNVTESFLFFFCFVFRSWSRGTSSWNRKCR